jgi:hypothetical protein
VRIVAAEWTPAKMMSKTAEVGPATVALFEAIMKAAHRQGPVLPRHHRARQSTAMRLEAASRHGNDIGATSYGSSPRSSSMGSTRLAHDTRRLRHARAGRQLR